MVEICIKLMFGSCEQKNPKLLVGGKTCKNRFSQIIQFVKKNFVSNHGILLLDFKIQDPD